MRFERPSSRSACNTKSIAAAPCQPPVIGVDAPAAVAEQRAARRVGKQFAERIDAVLQGHGRLKTTMAGFPRPSILAYVAKLYPCGCGAMSPVGASGRGRLLPAGGTAEERGVCGSITLSRTGR